MNEGVGYLVLPPAGNYPANKVIRSDSPEKRYRDRLAFPILQGNQHKVDSQIGFVIVSIEDNTIGLRTFGMGTLTHPRESHVIDSVSYAK